MSKYFKKIESLILQDNSVKFYKGLILSDFDKGVIIGIYIENLPKGIRVWDIIFPIYHGDSEINFQYSKISKFNFINDDEINYKENQINLVQNLTKYVNYRSNIKFISILNYINDMNIDELSKLRFNLLFYIYQEQYESALKLRKMIESITKDICPFDWWKDTLYIWNKFIKNPNDARIILIDRESIWMNIFSLK